MDAVGLVELGDAADSGEQERHQGDVQLARQARVDGGEAAGVVGAVVGRDLHAHQQHAGAGGAGAAHDLAQVALDLLGRLGAQAVVGAELDDDDGGPLRQDPAQAAQPAGAGVAGHAGVEHTDGRAELLHLLAEERRIGLVEGKSQPGGQAVAEESHQRRRRRRRRDAGGGAGSGWGRRGKSWSCPGSWCGIRCLGRGRGGSDRRGGPARGQARRGGVMGSLGGRLARHASGKGGNKQGRGEICESAAARHASILSRRSRPTSPRPHPWPLLHA
jgi:hypothetical protein